MTMKAFQDQGPMEKHLYLVSTVNLQNQRDSSSLGRPLLDSLQVKNLIPQVSVQANMTFNHNWHISQTCKLRRNNMHLIRAKTGGLSQSP